MNASARRATILVVDDEACIRDICAQVAAELGYECVTAQNGEDAIKLLDERRFDAVLTDVRMPRCDGFELFDHIHANAPDTAVAMMTGYGTIEQHGDPE